jgi:hypothetical protein
MARFSHRPSKSFNPGLNFGVSAESPDTFHIRYTSILDSNAKNRQVSGKDSNPSVFLSTLKRNNAVTRPKFSYEDYQNTEGFTFDSLNLYERIDLVNNGEERVRCKTPFCKLWKRQEKTQNGFRIYSGEYTIAANQVNVPRLISGKIENLKLLLMRKIKSRKSSPQKVKTKPDIRFLSSEKKQSRTKYKEEDFNCAEIAKKEIKYFENKLVLYPERKRWCYNIGRSEP